MESLEASQLTLLADPAEVPLAYERNPEPHLCREENPSNSILQDHDSEATPLVISEGEIAGELVQLEPELRGAQQVIKQTYREVMEPFKVSSTSMVDENGVLVHGNASSEAEHIDTSRLNREIKGLKRGLPVEPEAAVFVCVDDCRMNVMKALISGVVDTPYAHGLYQFDITLPTNYPNVPPCFNLMTTGQGSVYFGPNLFSSGYVCLSIINTWEGDPEEMWVPEQSSLLQVLLSIQTLVMDCNIMGKESGYETYGANYSGNVSYCNVVKYLNMKFAVLEQLRNPPREFAEVVIKHFTLKKQEVLATLRKWADEALEDTNSYSADESEIYNPGCCELFRSKTPRVVWAELRDELEKEFEKLN